MYKCHGFTFIEVMISLIIFSLILLGIDGAEFSTLRKVKANYYFAKGTLSAQNLLMLINSNHLAKEDYDNWLQEIKTSLPKAHAELKGNLLKITWGGLDDCQVSQIGIEGCLVLAID